MAVRVNPPECRYTTQHEWVRMEGDLAVFGITDYAQDQLGDVVYVELPEEGATTAQGEPFGVVESVKAASDLYAPLSGTVVEVNTRLKDGPELVNQDPYGVAWMLKVTPTQPAELERLMTAEQYEEYVRGLDS